jgi:hypothetical protein
MQQNRLFSIISHDLRLLMQVRFSQVFKENGKELTEVKEEFVDAIYETSKNTFFFYFKIYRMVDL